MTVGRNATPTPTPFQPLAPTYTPAPSPTPLPTVTQTPEPFIITPTNSAPTFPEVRPGGPLPGNIVNIMLLGSDARPGGGYRTDVMMLVSINRTAGTVSLVSFPRDLYVDITGWQTNRLNTAMAVGGFNTLAATYQANFGVRPAYYILTNFTGFKSIINSLGGIDVKAEKSLRDKCDLPWADGAGYCSIEAPATVPMNGDDALWYVRSRHSTSDFDRLRRAQEVIRAIFVGLMSRNAIARAPELFAIYSNNVETNLTLDQILPLLPIAQEIIKDPRQVRRYAITPSQAVPFVTPEGAMVLWPNLDAIRAIVYQAVFR
jgi:LCP family protein required for cell wall assembly